MKGENPNPNFEKGRTPTRTQTLKTEPKPGSSGTWEITGIGKLDIIGRKIQIVGKFWEKIENFWCKFNRKIEFFIIFGKLLLKIEPSEKTLFFYNIFFGFGGRISPFPPGYAHEFGQMWPFRFWYIQFFVSFLEITKEFFQTRYLFKFLLRLTISVLKIFKEKVSIFPFSSRFFLSFPYVTEFQELCRGFTNFFENRMMRITFRRRITWQQNLLIKYSINKFNCHII